MIDLDFAFYLTLATLVSGLIWLLDIVWLSRHREPFTEDGKTGGEPWYVEYSKSFFPVFLFVLVLRSFVIEPFRIPSGSMLPTLEVGDFILVNKYSYGLRLPVGNAKFVSIGEPKRGDVAVFRYPVDPSLDYIKRVVGIPGDKIVYRHKQLFINGETVALDYVEPYVKADAQGGMGAITVFKESLPGQTHQILVNQVSGSRDLEITVPDGHYFMMGDNRDDSRDSRVWGFVPEENLVGKAFFIWMHFDFSGGGFDFSRIGGTIR
jgi:signal peptidase I